MILVKVNGYDLHAKALRALTHGTVGREAHFEFSRSGRAWSRPPSSAAAGRRGTWR